MSESREDAPPAGGSAAEPYLRPRPAEKRATQQQVREVRARLLQGPGRKPEFEHELLCLFARNELSLHATLPVLAVGFFSLLWAPLLHAAAWLAIVLAMKLFMVAACLDFLSSARGEIGVAGWRRRLVWLELATSMTWAGVALLGLGTADRTATVFVLASLILLIAVKIFAPVRIVPLCAAA